MKTVTTTGTSRDGAYSVPSVEQFNLPDGSVLCASPEASTEQFSEEEDYPW